MLSSTKLLKPSFFNRDPRMVARALLGKLLVRKTGRVILAGRIVETEAYLGENDEAAHAAAGRTDRNAVLFGAPGFAYVYFIYGNYYCFNVSCLPDGVAGGVLFRALEPVAGTRQMAAARGIAAPGLGDLDNVSWLRQISSGPGRMCEALGITRQRDNGKNLASARSDLGIFDDGYNVPQISVTPRIGITKSPDHPLRYLISGNPFVSGRSTSPGANKVVRRSQKTVSR